MMKLDKENLTKELKIKGDVLKMKKEYDVLENLGYEKDMLEELKNYETSYIGDAVSEIADRYVSIYDHELWKTAPIIKNYIEESLEEFGTPKKINLVSIFQLGQFYYNERVLYENLYKIIFNIALEFLEELNVTIINDHMEEFTEELESTLIDRISDDNYMEDIEEVVKEVLEEWGN